MDDQPKRHKLQKNANKLEEAKSTLSFLIESIEKKDKSYISEFLCSKSKMFTLKLLNDSQLNSLGLILVDFLDQPLRIQAIEVLKGIPFHFKNKNVFYDSLKTRVVDISKLLYLKGKLDYLKMTRMKSEKKKEPKVVINE
ncbi:hypothetical protein NBO_12g0018 [Nosema bombycis CQ1]|uniref:Uncharacterized protein n=1 Tax=Nosema bombycis (strain CQ1 / CVCC 102059) TaxID=578461 RepID=R0KXI9_NOSB1|nr:hypothetical protein NBO_12g0018 [Nosema bombycis CQ1]|eukprot:EOB14912.1 hypothetical protein NBO_12g0018 [Nosema bombycis CQ1]